jgi:hypothetical protein
MTRIQLKDWRYSRSIWCRIYMIWCRQKKTIAIVNETEYWIEFEDDMIALIFMLTYPHNR